MNHLILYLVALFLVPLIITGVLAKLYIGTNDPLIAYLLAMLVTHFAYGRLKNYAEESDQVSLEKKED